MLKKDKLRIDENGVYYYGDYHPYRVNGAINPVFDREFSGMILALKNREKNYKSFFVSILNEVLEDNENLILMCVPSHKMGELGTIPEIIKVVCENRRMINGTNLLYRHVTVEKNSTGGNRSIEKHLHSIAFDSEEYDTQENLLYFKDKDIIIIDDVCTSGGSLLACKQILKSGIKSVKSITCFAFSKTKW